MAEPANLALQILQTVNNSKSAPTPTDYLAYKLGTSSQEIERYVSLLQDQGIVRLRQNGVEKASAAPVTTGIAVG